MLLTRGGVRLAHGVGLCPSGRHMLEVTIFTKEGKELKRYELEGSRPLSMGRGTACDIQLPFQDVSRSHAKLVPDEDGEWVLIDQDSTHGCVVGEERKREVEVRPGLEVRLGSAVLRFGDLADRIGAELNAQLEDTDPSAETIAPLAETLKPAVTDAPTAEIVISPQKKKSGLFWRS
ncbi:MAG: FHA domain-containing protein [Planctomycetota bacterium]|nr:FHA domain-containing protein [Planctomycetota bacterium]